MTTKIVMYYYFISVHHSSKASTDTDSAITQLSLAVLISLDLLEDIAILRVLF